MPEQNYSNHAKVVPVYHYVLAAVVLLSFIGSLVNLFHSFDDHSRLYNAALIAALATAMLMVYVILRTFPLKAQDRAIRAEENLRHYVLTGKLIDRRLKIKQVVALRFAPDAEFPALATKAAAENLSPKAIKQAVKQWRADDDRL